MKKILIIILLTVLSCKNDTSGSEIVESKAVTKQVKEVVDVSDIDLKTVSYTHLTLPTTPYV